MTHHDDRTGCGPLCHSRRALLVGAGAGLAVTLAGCATYGQAAPPAPAPAARPGKPSATAAPSATGAPSAADAPSVADAPSATDTPSATDAPSAAGGAVLARSTEIPVGGGKVFADRQVVVTQPVAGTFKAFTAICTHQGCTVAEVRGGTINCPCHGSRFRVADGAVAGGPASRPLAAVNLTVDGGAIRLA
jgi:Rieske Fe-S protein